MCGIFGVFNVRKAAELTVIGLHALQHRAHDYAGIVSTDGTHAYRFAGRGVARDVFTKERLDQLHGKMAIGHVRYPTVHDDPTRDNTQPIDGVYCGQSFALAHNGNLINKEELKHGLPGVKTDMDSEVPVRMLEQLKSGDVLMDVARVLSKLKGSFELLIQFPDRLIAVRDPRGNHPLSIGRLEDGYVASSETVALPNVRASLVCDVDPGTMVSITKNGMSTIRYGARNLKHCRFEAIYFAHPASRVFDENIGKVRRLLGRMLGALKPVETADVITPIPDSSNFMAMGFAETNGAGAFHPVIFRSHYVGRTFIAAKQAEREEKVAGKFNFDADEIRGKNVVLVDDSIVRGTTMPKIVRVVRELGAREVHIRIASPPIRWSCKYGINTPTNKELVAHGKCDMHIPTFGADSLEFLPMNALRSVSPNPNDFCYSCMTGEYWQ